MREILSKSLSVATLQEEEKSSLLQIMLFVLLVINRKIYSQTICKHTQQVSIHLVSDKLPFNETMSINIQSWRLYGILHYDPSLTCYLWSLIPTFFWSAPSRRDSMSGAFPLLRPPATFVLGVHHGAFAQQQLRSCDLAFARRQVQRRFASGAFFSREAVDRCGLPSKTTGRRGRCAVGGRRKLWECWAPTRSTDKGTMNVLDLKQNTFIYKHSRHLFYNTTFAEMMCKDFFNEEASKDNVIPGSW